LEATIIVTLVMGIISFVLFVSVCCCDDLVVDVMLLGGEKENDPSTWEIISGSMLSKSDITNAYTVGWLANSNDMFVAVAWERLSALGKIMLG